MRFFTRIIGQTATFSWEEKTSNFIELVFSQTMQTGPDQIKIVQKLYLALNPPIMVQITIKTYFYEIPDAIANFMQPLK